MTTTSLFNVPAADASSSNATTSRALNASKTQSTQDRFLTLLISQMKAQDPLNPMDNAQMTSQLAQISTVDGVDKLNKTVEKLLAQFGVMEQLNANSMIGHSVLLAGNRLELSYNDQQQGISAAGLQIPQAASSVKVQITDGNGLLIRTLNLGALGEGTQTFGWDGKTDAGSTAAAGRYNFSVTAQANGQAVDSTALSLARIDGAQRQGDNTLLNVAGFGLKSQDDIVAVY